MQGRHHSFHARRFIAAGATLALVGGMALVAANPAGANEPSWGGRPPGGRNTLYVAPNGGSHQWSANNQRWSQGDQGENEQGRSCESAQFSKIGDAVAAASAGSTVVVCRGTYKEDVVITKPLTLLGKSATIDATGLPGAPIGSIQGQALYNGISIESSHVTVDGFTVKGAEGEGILAVNPKPVSTTLGGQPVTTGTPIVDVTIRNNNVTGNDLGANNPNSPYVFCTPNGGGDCGEGIHLLSVANSWVVNNKSVGNSGGILLTDEFGPTHDNTISGNLVLNNVEDCGVTLPSHNVGVNPGTGATLPTIAGVYRNRVIGNRVIGNGTKGFGAGIGVFAPFPGAASYNNLVAFNFAEGNGLGGISVHSHAPNASVDGNIFTSNAIGKNNVSLQDGADVSPKDTQTSGIVIWSAVTKYHFVVTNNLIFDNQVGIWLTPATISATGLNTNHFINVQTHVLNAS